MTQANWKPVVKGDLLTEGKTKTIHAAVGDDRNVIVGIKDDLTAGNGARHDVIEGKNVLANAIICAVFELLQQCGILVAFQWMWDAVSFVARKCRMLPFEVVVRREVHGSARKRYPFLRTGHRFERLVVEFCLKTTGRKWKDHSLPCDDPLIRLRDGKVELYDPSEPFFGGVPFLVLNAEEVDGLEFMPEMAETAMKTFLVLEKAWAIIGYVLLDFKVEFGLGLNDAGETTLFLADDIEPSSWRIRAPDGRYFDKEFYRLGGDTGGMLDIYKKTAQLVQAFRVPKQQLVLWRGSDKDDLSPFDQAIAEVRKSSDVLGQYLSQVDVTCSFHKEPERALWKKSWLLSANPNSAFINYIGLSNAAGSALAAGLPVLVVTVPNGLDKHDETVWSSLENPTSVPPAVVLRPSNAVLFVLQHFAASSPLLYMILRYEQEKRMVNSVNLGLGYEG